MTERPSPGDRVGLARVRWETLLAVVLLALVVDRHVALAGLPDRPELRQPDLGGHRGRDHVAADGVDHHRRRDRPVGRVDGRAVRSVLGSLFAAGVPIELGIPSSSSSAPLGGLLNGVLVTRVGPAIAGGHPRHPRAVPRHGPDRPGSQGDQRVPELVHDLRLQPDPRHRRSRGPSSCISRWPSSSASSCTGRGSAAQLYAIGKNRRPPASPASRSPASSSLLFVLSGTVAALAGVILTRAVRQRAGGRRLGLTLTS